MDESQKANLFLLSKNKSNEGTRGEKGVGVGMYLVKEMVDKINGEIAVVSQIKKGDCSNNCVLLTLSYEK